MVQSMEILSMNAQELRTYLEKIAQENPVIEVDDPVSSDDSVVALRKLQWLESKNVFNKYFQASVSPEQDEDLPENYGHQFMIDETLNFFLKAQMHAMRLPRHTKLAVDWIIDNLDENGWYREHEGKCPFTPEVLADALEVVRGMEPAGVGASNLSESLLLQIERMKGRHDLEKRIAREYLDEMGKTRYNNIAKKLGVSQEKVRLACDIIRTLNPRPGAGFDIGGRPDYIRADIVVTDTAGRLEAQLTEHGVPELHLNSYYCRLVKESDDPEVREYLAGKLRQAEWLLRNIEQRKNTVINCIESILKLQSDFFREGKKLSPMTLKDVAGLTGVHESTVSRAMRGKYLQCIHGVFPVNDLFSRNLGEGGKKFTQNEVKNLLRSIIDREDKRNPLSDRMLCERMAAAEMNISRRAVAKYRLQLNIPSATGRRRI